MKIIILLLIIIWFITIISNFSKFNLFLFLFIISSAIERFWETFITTRQNILDKTSKFDWLFNLISLSYILMMFGTVLEYLFIPKKLIYPLVFLGFITFFLALLLRLWAIKTLEEDWNIFVLEESKHKIKQSKLKEDGPYKYIRHPIYLGVIIESISIPLIFNSYYTLGFAVLFCLPLVILRAYLEENESIKKFGQDYIKYKTKVFAFLPFRRSLFRTRSNQC